MKTKKSIAFVAVSLTSTLIASAATVVLDEATINASAEVSGATVTGGTDVDLGTSTLTYTDFTVTSTNNGSASNIFANDIGSGTEMVQIGNNGHSGWKASELSNNELMIVTFNQTVNLTQVTLHAWGNNDDPALIGLAGDPGVISVSTFTNTGAVDGDGLEAQPTGYAYDALSDLLTLRIDGFAHQVTINFENPVSLSSFTVTSGSSDAGAGGIGFGGFTYAAVPEPSTALLGALGLLALLRRRR
ncbi:MAG: PEP-CTERM sorting domain-containing protein [Verrucomicrobiae bacterium]|nr:PEP-CTERM sorting domain-containing protein [Verrucomicrobiae bacterium]NNJ87250.1 PEP-CTERM sorting domain-containing protein [Akkermansiaceae bacterium]